MNGRLLALLANDVEDITLAALARAVTQARRRDAVVIHRAFVRSRAGSFVLVQRTARMRVH